MRFLKNDNPHRQLIMKHIIPKRNSVQRLIEEQFYYLDEQKYDPSAVDLIKAPGLECKYGRVELQELLDFIFGDPTQEPFSIPKVPKL